MTGKGHPAAQEAAAEWCGGHEGSVACIAGAVVQHAQQQQQRGRMLASPRYTTQGCSSQHEGAHKPRKDEDCCCAVWGTNINHHVRQASFLSPQHPRRLLDFSLLYSNADQQAFTSLLHKQTPTTGVTPCIIVKQTNPSTARCSAEVNKGQQQNLSEWQQHGPAMSMPQAKPGQTYNTSSPRSIPAAACTAVL